MKIIFAGTPEFAVPTLQALIESKHEILAVYTQPDRPAGRGRHLTQSPVKHLALQHELAVRQPATLKDLDVQAQLKAWKADIMVVVAYGLLLPQAVLDMPSIACINVHASILPRWRGAAPIQQAILAGDTETGVSIMKMEAGLDTGPVYRYETCKINATDTAESLQTRLSKIGADALLLTFQDILNGDATIEEQDEDMATYAPKIKKTDGLIVWRDEADMIERKIRAYTPWPGAYTFVKGQRLRVIEAEVIDVSAVSSGQITSVTPDSVDIAAGKKVLRLLVVQLAGGKAMPIADLLHAKADLFVVGEYMGSE